ncbi:hypothetical protein LJC55_01300 [Eubacteriales bacterium OttesenSCG-928-N14]|nr:hypothetical protein [Eubacteriales bacterium OttesenSCG-928-N14]
MATMKQRLQQGEPILGTFISIVDHGDIVRIMQQAGFDFIVIDNEHGYMDYSKTAAMIGLARALDIGIMVRIPECRREVILKYMEMGAQGLLLPCCDTAEDAKALVQYAKYAPEGNRGVALYRAHTQYKPLKSGVEYMQQTNDETLLIGQIESATAVKNVGEILDVDGLDGVFIGPNDLSQGLGIYGQMQNPVLLDAIGTVLQQTKMRQGKYAGIFSGGAPEEMKEWIKRGMQVNLYASETTLVMNAAKDAVSRIKA